ncbi:hypothetical protein L226DRAFT_103735 [Lentinus tigrinus ALCF2SS1-7]|uniref:uncharacterized protein n=1 Tax=Lentinus tigrinus ALCF2SS1-7 TaxID=1328758 RepID=UPI001165F4AA|nr:hypothetical protein L226DRAFT_103735 [Lentinus tigrinus ALCF2SS1-7]
MAHVGKFKLASILRDVFATSRSVLRVPRSVGLVTDHRYTDNAVVSTVYLFLNAPVVLILFAVIAIRSRQL